MKYDSFSRTICVVVEHITPSRKHNSITLKIGTVRSYILTENFGNGIFVSFLIVIENKFTELFDTFS